MISNVDEYFIEEPLATLSPSTNFVLAQLQDMARERNLQEDLRLHISAADQRLAGAELVDATCSAMLTRRWGEPIRLTVNVYRLCTEDALDSFQVQIGRPGSQPGIRDDRQPGIRLLPRAPWELLSQARIDESGTSLMPDIDRARDEKVPGVIPAWTRPHALTRGLRVAVQTRTTTHAMEQDYAASWLPANRRLAHLMLLDAAQTSASCPECGAAISIEGVRTEPSTLRGNAACPSGHASKIIATIRTDGDLPPDEWWQRGWTYLGRGTSEIAIAQALRQSAGEPFEPKDPRPEALIYRGLSSVHGREDIFRCIPQDPEVLANHATYLAVLERGAFVRSFQGRGRARAYTERPFVNPSQLTELLGLLRESIQVQHPEWNAASHSDEAIVQYFLDAVTTYPGIQALVRPMVDPQQVEPVWFSLQNVGPEEFMLLEDLASALSQRGVRAMPPGYLYQQVARDEKSSATRLGRLRIAAAKVTSEELEKLNPWLLQLAIKSAQTRIAHNGETAAPARVKRVLTPANTSAQRAELTTSYESRPQNCPRNWGTHLRQELSQLARLTHPDVLGGWPDEDTPPQHWRVFIVSMGLTPREADIVGDDEVLTYLAVNPQGKIYISRRRWLSSFPIEFDREVEGADELRDRSGAYRAAQDENSWQYEMSRIYTVPTSDHNSGVGQLSTVEK